MSARREDFRSVVPFISAVKARQCIWNSSIAAYTKKDITTAAWKEIAEELKDTEHNCRDRWKNIRTAFVRSLKPPKPGSGKSFKRTYYLASYLSFLLPYVKGKSSGKLEDSSLDESSGNIEEDVEDASEEPPCEVQFIEISPPKIQKIEMKEEKNEPAYTERINMDKEMKEEKNEAAFKEWTDMKKDMIKKDHDADEYFLLSVLPDIRKLSAQRKRSFKVETMTLLNQFLDEDEREACGSNSSAGFSN